MGNFEYDTFSVDDTNQNSTWTYYSPGLKIIVLRVNDLNNLYNKNSFTRYIMIYYSFKKHKL